jgi:hypothetical protein
MLHQIQRKISGRQLFAHFGTQHLKDTVEFSPLWNPWNRFKRDENRNNNSIINNEYCTPVDSRE